MTKKRLFHMLIPLGVAVSISSAAYAEIKSKPVLKEIFEGCIAEEIEEDFLSSGAHFEYCGCVTHKVATGMDLSEAMVMGIDMMSAENEEEEMKIMLANEKVMGFITQCVVKVFDE